MKMSLHPQEEAANSSAAHSDRLLRLRDVLRRFPVSRSAWYAGIANGLYPKPVRIGRRSVAWRDSDITDLIERVGRPQ